MNRVVIFFAAILMLLTFDVLPRRAASQGIGVNDAQPAAVEPEDAFRIRKPDLQDLERIRFITDSDYPPFNYLDEDGELTGFNVDLAQTLCDELSVECSVRSVSWEQLLETLKQGEADAVIASMRVSEATLREVDFTDAYYHTPARFVALKTNPQKMVTPEALVGQKVGVVAKTAHQAYLGDFFVGVEIVTFETPEAAKTGLREGKVKFLFGDGVSLMFWINGTLSEACCEFRGGPFTESKYFGEGISIAVPKGNRKLREALNYGLFLARSEGRFEELYLRYFPLSFF